MSLKTALEGQIKDNRIEVLVYDVLAKNYTEAIISVLRDNPDVIYLDLHARGKYISKAVDIVEILKRELKIKQPDITTNTKEVVSWEGNPIRVSEIHITLKNV